MASVTSYFIVFNVIVSWLLHLPLGFINRCLVIWCCYWVCQYVSAPRLFIKEWCIIGTEIVTRKSRKSYISFSVIVKPVTMKLWWCFDYLAMHVHWMQGIWNRRLTAAGSWHALIKASNNYKNKFFYFLGWNITLSSVGDPEKSRDKSLLVIPLWHIIYHHFFFCGFLKTDKLWIVQCGVCSCFDQGWRM